MIISHVQNLRFNYLKKNVDLSCDIDNELFIPNEYIENNLENLSKLVEVNNFDWVNVNLSEKEINRGAELFFALNSCPSKFVRLYWRVMYGHKSRIAMMASNIIKKADDSLRTKALRIFAKVTSVLGFQHIISYPRESQSFASTKTEIMKDILGVKGKNGKMEK